MDLWMGICAFGMGEQEDLAGAADAGEGVLQRGVGRDGQDGCVK